MKNRNYSSSRKRYRIKYKNIAIALFLLVFVVLCIVSWKSLFSNNTNKNKNETSQSSNNTNDKADKNNNNGKNNKDNKNDNADKNNTSDKNVDKKNENTTNQVYKPESNIPAEQVLSNAAFIGDSRMKGLLLYNGLTNVKDYSDVGLNVKSAFTKAFIPTPEGNKVILKDALSSSAPIERIYISFGINELGWPSLNTFIEEYSKLVNMVKELQPKSKIYVMSILPVTKSRSDKDAVFNNAKINTVNNNIENMSKKLGVTYLDCSSVVSDAEGNLVAESSTDGIHMNKEYCQKLLQFIKENP